MARSQSPKKIEINFQKFLIGFSALISGPQTQAVSHVGAHTQTHIYYFCETDQKFISIFFGLIPRVSVLLIYGYLTHFPVSMG